MAIRNTWQNDTLMVPLITTDVTCSSVNCSGPMTCNGMNMNNISAFNGTFGNLSTNTFSLASIPNVNSISNILCVDSTGNIKKSGILSSISSDIVTTGVVKTPTVNTGTITEYATGFGTNFLNTINYPGAVSTSDVSKNKVLVLDNSPGIQQIQYRTDFVDTDSTQNIIGDKTFTTARIQNSYIDQMSEKNLGVGINVSSLLRLYNTPAAPTTENKVIVVNTTDNVLKIRTDFVDTSTSQELSNKTINNLVTSGTSVTFFSPSAGMVIYRWSVQTISTVGPIVGVVIPTVASTAYTVQTTCQGFVIAGGNINKGLSRFVSNCFINVAGTVSIVGTLQTLSTNSGGLNAASLVNSVGAANIIVQVTGTSGDTINWTGETIVYF